MDDDKGIARTHKGPAAKETLQYTRFVPSGITHTLRQHTAEALLYAVSHNPDRFRTLLQFLDAYSLLDEVLKYPAASAVFQVEVKE